MFYVLLQQSEWNVQYLFNDRNVISILKTSELNLKILRSNVLFQYRLYAGFTDAFLQTFGAIIPLILSYSPHVQQVADCIIRIYQYHCTSMPRVVTSYHNKYVSFRSSLVRRSQISLFAFVTHYDWFLWFLKIENPQLCFTVWNICPSKRDTFKSTADTFINSCFLHHNGHFVGKLKQSRQTQALLEIKTTTI